MRGDAGLGTRVADSLARQLAAAGIRHAFGIPGGEVLSLIDALGAAGIEYVTARHETAAGLMAEGASAASDAPGLLVLTVGPGVSNAVNAIANAFLDRVPLIVLSGAVDVERPGSYTHQVFDQRALLRPIVKASFVAAPETIARTTCEALALAQRHPRGPVHIEVPMAIASSLVSSLEPEPAPAPESVVLHRATLHEAAAWLARAERPLVIAGLEAVDSQVAFALAELVRTQQLPLLTTYKAKGVLDEADPLCIGAIALSPRADALVRPLIQAADVVLLVGYDPVEMRASYARPFSAHTHVVELSPVRREHAMHEAQLPIVGDLAASLRELTGRCSPPRPRWLASEPTGVRTALRDAFAPDARARFCPLAVSEVLSRVLPDTARLTIDTGAHRIVLSQALRARWPGQVLQSNGLCTMGYALPCAIGLARASGRKVIAAMGDGGFEMVAGELATVRDLGLPLILVVFDDRSLALIDQKQQAAGLVRRGVWLGATDHVALAQAFGGRGVRVEDSGALEQALLEALQIEDSFSVVSCALPRGAYENIL
ncbi:MAG TPA: thiamine pyrophosphate-binding protein [Polyangiales bacterium]|nr:thiamine pyrophosphate-binding protein [Polyangiales bacterium]